MITIIKVFIDEQSAPLFWSLACNWNTTQAKASFGIVGSWLAALAGSSRLMMLGLESGKSWDENESSTSFMKALHPFKTSNKKKSNILKQSSNLMLNRKHISFYLVNYKLGKSSVPCEAQQPMLQYQTLSILAFSKFSVGNYISVSASPKAWIPLSHAPNLSRLHWPTQDHISKTS